MDLKDKVTPVFDWEKGDFVVAAGKVAVVGGSDAVKHVVSKALHTERGVHLVYANLENPDLHHKYGSDVYDVLRRDLDEATRVSELRRTLREALVYDAYIKDVVDIVIEKSEDDSNGYVASYTLVTVFDTKVKVEGVALND